MKRAYGAEAKEQDATKGTKMHVKNANTTTRKA